MRNILFDVESYKTKKFKIHLSFRYKEYYLVILLVANFECHSLALQNNDLGALPGNAPT